MDLFRLVLVQEVVAAAQAEAVWAVFADIERWPQWNSVCQSVRILEGTPWQPGFRFHMVLRMARLPVPFEPTVVEAAPARRVIWSSRRFIITGRRAFTFTDVGDGRTRITDEKTFTSPVLPVQLVYPRAVIVRMSEAWLDALAREAASRGPRGDSIPM